MQATTSGALLPNRRAMSPISSYVPAPKRSSTNPVVCAAIQALNESIASASTTSSHGAICKQPAELLAVARQLHPDVLEVVSISKERMGRWKPLPMDEDTRAGAGAGAQHTNTSRQPVLRPSEAQLRSLRWQCRSLHTMRPRGLRDGLRNNAAEAARCHEKGLRDYTERLVCAAQGLVNTPLDIPYGPAELPAQRLEDVLLGIELLVQQAMLAIRLLEHPSAQQPAHDPAAAADLQQPLAAAAAAGSQVLGMAASANAAGLAAPRPSGSAGRPQHTAATAGSSHGSRAAAVARIVGQAAAGPTSSTTVLEATSAHAGPSLAALMARRSVSTVGAAGPAGPPPAEQQAWQTWIPLWQPQQPLPLLLQDTQQLLRQRA